MFRTIIAGTAVTGALTLGVAGVAGTARGSDPDRRHGSTPRPQCAKLPALQARVAEGRGHVERPPAQGAGP